ncbi:hypothetical protein [Brevundimonas sp. P7753]|uniref:hypothetical protein n=1 Tax=Brevundimonas sp. P7753 TaxID=2726982 RepID=UPI0015BF2CB9|nr:hypothetical protein [Brevundimonas sp. P7753]NWE51216.1 hypothetical protein [Brevundimonas sp. P7753]
MSRLLDLENFVAEKLAWHQRIASDPTVSLSAKAVAGFILHDLNASEGGAWRGQESMAAGLGVSPRQLRRLLDELESASYLQVEVRKGRGRTNICRATLPDERAVTSENRTSTAAQTVEKRTPATVQTPKNRTSASRKPDMDVRQYLYDPIKKFPTQQSRRSCSEEVTPARIIPFEHSGIRERVMGIAGEGATISYLDPARWDADGSSIVCTSATGFARLRDLAGKPLAAIGVSITLQAGSVGRLAA